MANTWQQVSDEMAARVESASQHTVRVEGRRRLAATGIVWAADGVIVTAHHVVTRDDRLRVGLADGSVVPAELVGRDPSTDIAVLRAEIEGLSVPQWAQDTAVGQMVLALGRPGQTMQATFGIITAVGGTWRTPAGGHVERYIQPDIVMYPGFSGGPLLGAAGEIIGMNTSALLRGNAVTIPYQTLQQTVATLLEHGHIRRGYLGVGVQPVRLPAALAEQLEQETGLLVMSVEQDSPAETGGLLLGDTIVTLDNEAVHHTDDLHAQLSPQSIGHTVTVQIIRGGEVRSVDVVVGSR